jgi:hypothetical protein
MVLPTFLLELSFIDLYLLNQTEFVIFHFGPSVARIAFEVRDSLFLNQLNIALIFLLIRFLLLDVLLRLLMQGNSCISIALFFRSNVLTHDSAVSRLHFLYDNFVVTRAPRKPRGVSARHPSPQIQFQNYPPILEQYPYSNDLLLFI